MLCFIEKNLSYETMIKTLRKKGILYNKLNCASYDTLFQ